MSSPTPISQRTSEIINPDSGGLGSWRSQTMSVELGSFHSDLDDDHTGGEDHLAADPHKTGFFARGREWEARTDIHKYTEAEKQILKTFDSFDYLPPHSTAYKVWLRHQPQRFDWDRWVMMGMIGFCTGIVGFLLHQLIDVISELKWDKIRDFINEGDLFAAWGWAVWYSVLFALVSTVLVVVLRPAAAGSGIPELIGFLNGTAVAAIFNVKTMAVKFVSCACAVASGLPVGPEGPMIHLGALVGAGLSQFRSRTLGFDTPFFTRFRNSEDRRNFISAGAGAGISSAFGAPVGGLLFAMEEVSSFWNLKLGWQTFFCTMISAFTTDLFNSCFDKFVPVHTFGQFFSTKYILFDVQLGIPINLLLFIPAAIIGILGGLLGALFTFLNVKISRGRRWVQGKCKRRWTKMFVRMLEPVVIMFITATLTIVLPKGFDCTRYHCGLPAGYTCVDSHCMLSNHSNLSPRCIDSFPTSPRVNSSESSARLEHYLCDRGITYEFQGNGTKMYFSNDSYSQIATLLFGTGEQTVRHLFSRSTHLEFSAGPLITVLVVYFSLACWAAGSAISSGLVVPMLLIGALYGRVIGYGMVRAFGIFPQGSYWSWIDPGALALIGAASFFGGVSRLTMSLTVIMIEITNDVQFLLPIMVGVMCAKWTGDYLTHPLYHALLELKCIPFLDEEPVIVHAADESSGHHHSHGKGGPSNLELYQARHAMSTPCVTICIQEKVGQIARMLLFLHHGGFPVVRNVDGKQLYCGLITRQQLQVIISHGEHIFSSEADLPKYTFEDFLENEPRSVPVSFETMTSSKSRTVTGITRLSQYADEERYNDLYIDLMPYINQSQPSVPANFSLHRAYIIFRTLGLRHMPVVDFENKVVGIITRKDLMGFALEEKIAYHRQTRHSRPAPAAALLASSSMTSALSGNSGTSGLLTAGADGEYHLLTES